MMQKHEWHCSSDANNRQGVKSTVEAVRLIILESMSL